MTEPEIATAAPPSRKKLLIGVTGAVVVAAVALVVFILPAEYGIDPTGAGKALGVTKLSEGEAENIYLKRGQARTNTLFTLDASAQPTEATLQSTLAGSGLTVPAGTAIKSDRFTFELPPFESIELKYELAQGAPMIFSWRASGPLDYDMHGHPYEGGEEMTESFAITDGTSQTAAYVAPFTGIHGWFWQNRTFEPVTLTLDATGGFTASKIFNQAGEQDRALTPPARETPAEEAPPEA